jgi:uncharacterized membrane protein
VRFLRPLTWILAIALVIAVVVAYPSLPTSIPQSIDVNGQGKGFTPRSPFTCRLPMCIGLITLIGLEVLRVRLPKKPELFNFPGKEQLLKLPSEYRTGAVVRMQQFMDVMNLQLVITFGMVQLMIWRGARGESSGGLSIATLVFPMFMLIAIGLFLNVIQSEVDAAQRRYDSRRNPLQS